jgi:hypothetical protein
MLTAADKKWNFKKENLIGVSPRLLLVEVAGIFLASCQI